ncbi:hypothetical protein V2W45_1468303 [Cenococcum geophilum]
MPSSTSGSSSSIHREEKASQQSLHGNNANSESRQLPLQALSSHGWPSGNYPNLLYPPLPIQETHFTANPISFEDQQTPISESVDWLNSSDVTAGSSQVLPTGCNAASKSLSDDFVTSFPTEFSPFAFNEAAPYPSEHNETYDQGQESSFVLSDSRVYHSLSTPLQGEFIKHNQAPSDPTKDLSIILPRSVALTSPISTPASNAKTSSPSRIEKRKLNTLAARRYRQKRVDQMNGLEAALKETQLERDALKVRVARLEGEAEILRQLLQVRK